MNKFVWGGAKEKGVNIDYNHQRTLMVIKSRLNYARLAKALVEKDMDDQAIKVLDHCMENLPLDKIPYDPYMADIIEAYFMAGGSARALEMTDAFCKYYYERLEYYLKQAPYVINSAEYEIRSAMQYTSQVAEACTAHGNKEKGDEISSKLETYYTEYSRQMNQGE
jgi:hypothetical protein